MDNKTKEEIDQMAFEHADAICAAIAKVFEASKTPHFNISFTSPINGECFMAVVGSQDLALARGLKVQNAILTTDPLNRPAKRPELKLAGN